MREINAVLPRDGGAAPLDFVIAVMAFLAALALGASLIADRTTQGWSHGLAAKLTVQIVPPDNGDAKQILDRETDAAVGLLRAAPGIAHAAPMSDAELNALVAPWVGQNGLTSDIPLPRLIDASITPGMRVDVAALVQQLRKAAPHATLDDHSRWISRLGAIADTVRYSAYGILLLIACATTAAVSFATRAGLDAHHEMVALLHQMGARASFIARTVEWHYFTSALVAAAAGHGVRGASVSGRRRARAVRRRCGAVPAALDLGLVGNALASGGARRHRADRLGHGAHICPFGGARHLLTFKGYDTRLFHGDDAGGAGLYSGLCAVHLAVANDAGCRAQSRWHRGFDRRRHTA